MADENTDPLATDDGNAALFQSKPIGGTELSVESPRTADGDDAALSRGHTDKVKEDEKLKDTVISSVVTADDRKPKPVTPETLREHRTAGFFRVALIGYPGTGKTCFLNRLKWEITRSDDADKKGQYRIEPSLPAKRISQTAGVEWHGFWWSASTENNPLDSATDEDGAGDLAKSFVVYDLAGEALSKPDLEGRAHEILANSDAIIIVLPSDVVFAAGDPAGVYLARARQHLAERLAPPMPQPESVAAATVADGPTPPAPSAPNLVAQAIQSAQIAAKSAILSKLQFDQARLAIIANDSSQLDGLETRLKADREGIEQFLDRLGGMVSVSGAMRNAGSDYDEFHALPDADRRRHGRWVRPPLAYIAISKTDSLLSDEPPIVPLDEKLVQDFWRRGGSGSGMPPKCSDPDWSKHEREARKLLDENPERTVKLACESLRTVVTKTFARHKIDFLTSFDGLQKSSVFFPLEGAEQYSTTIDYTADSYGVPAVIDWIAYARKRRQPRAWRPLFALPVGLSSAIEAWKPPFGSSRGGAAGISLAATLLVFTGLAYFFPGLLIYLVVAQLVLMAPLLVPLTFGLTRLVRTAAVKLEPIEFYLARRGNFAIWPAFLILLAVLCFTGSWASNRLSGFSKAEALAERPGEARALRDLSARYPAEAAQLRRSTLFQQGRLSESVQPWSGIPPAGGYFGVPAGQVRNQYEGVLATMRRWKPTGRIDQAQAATVADQLAGLQNTIVAARAGRANADIDRRSFSYFHLGLAQFRSGQWRDAIAQFEALRALIETTEPPTTPQADHRAKGVSIALRHAKGLALLKLDQPDEAKEQLGQARAMANDARNWLTTNPSAPHVVAPDPRLTPAQFSTLDIDADLIAAWLRTFDPVRDLAADSEFRSVVEDMGTRATGIPPNHPLSTNLTLAEALLGLPLSIAPDLDGPQRVAPEDRDALEEARDASEGQGDWEEVETVRLAFEQGQPGDIAELFDPAKAADVPERARQREFAKKLAKEILGDLRTSKRSEGKSEDLAAFVDKVPGFKATALAEDMAGGWWWYTLWWVLPWLFVALACWVFLLVLVRTIETNKQQTSARHHADRMRAQEQREAAAAGA